MSLFICSNCGCLENTALCGYWFRTKMDEPLCSECDPRIGKWHGCFPKKKWEGEEVLNEKQKIKLKEKKDVI